MKIEDGKMVFNYDKIMAKSIELIGKKTLSSYSEIVSDWNKMNSRKSKIDKISNQINIVDYVGLLKYNREDVELSNRLNYIFENGLDLYFRKLKIKKLLNLHRIKKIKNIMSYERNKG